MGVLAGGRRRDVARGTVGTLAGPAARGRAGRLRPHRARRRARTRGRGVGRSRRRSARQPHCRNGARRGGRRGGAAPVGPRARLPTDPHPLRRQCQHLGRRGAGQALRRKRHRPVPHRVRLPDAPRPAEQRRAGGVVPAHRRRGSTEPRHLPAARRGRRQAGPRTRPRARAQPLPRIPLDAVAARPPGCAARPGAGDPVGARRTGGARARAHDRLDRGVPRGAHAARRRRTRAAVAGER